MTPITKDLAHSTTPAARGSLRSREGILPSERDHHLSLAEAADLTRRHRREHWKEGHAGFFFRAAFDGVLAQDGCVAMRIYRGKSADGARHHILVGVGAEGNDLASGTLMEQDIPCPPFCDTTSPLLEAADLSKRAYKAPTVPPTKDHTITLEFGLDLVRRHGAEHGDQPRGGLFHRAALDDLLVQPGCIGVRIYRGKSPHGEREFVLVAVDSDGRDLASGVLVGNASPACDSQSPFLG